MIQTLFLQSKQYLYDSIIAVCCLFLLCGCASTSISHNVSPEIMDKKAENTIDNNKLASQRLKEEYEKLQKKRLCAST